jgi:hypothetical protein
MFVSLFLPTAAAATITIITQPICTGNVTYSKLFICRSVTEVAIILIIQPYPVLMEGVTLVQFGGLYTNFVL